MTRPSAVTSRAAFRRAAAAGDPGARVPVEVRVPVEDPYDAYRRARGDDPSFFLETGGGNAGWGYFGVEPTAFTEVRDDGVLDAIEELLAEEQLVRAGCDVPYPGGLFGWLSYDAARELESLPGHATDDRNLPRLQLGTFPCVAAWPDPHEPGDPLRVVCARRVGDSEDPDDAYDAALDRATALATAAVDGDPTTGPPPATGERAAFESDAGPAAFADRVRRVKREIRAGETFQTNVSQRLVAPAVVHPVAAYDALRRVNPAPYAGLVEFPGVDLVSASPELLLEREGAAVRTEPIAGTRPRGDTPAADADLEAALRGDEKERAEHAMLVDLERNDLGKVCEYGSVTVDEYRRVDRYSAVMHLVSDVSGTLRSDATLADAIAAVFPGGTITGAPKPRTMAIVDEVEATRRGPYTGSVAAIGFDGRATLNIVIRTLVRVGDEYHLRVGAGIVHDSVPEREYEETLDKARALIAAVDDALDERAALGVEP